MASLKGRPGEWLAYYDTVIPGLELRISPKGARLWSVRCWLGRRQVRVSLGSILEKKLKAARARAREIIDDASRGVDPRRPRGERLTVEALALEALADLELKDSTRREWTRLVKVEIGPALRLVAEDLDRAAIRRWCDKLKARSPSTALHAFEVLQRAYSWGVSRDKIKGTPFVGLDPPSRRRQSNRVLSTDELRAVWKALWLMDHLGEYDGRSERVYVDATRLLVLTAARREMVVGMRRSEFEALDDPAGARWIIPADRMKAGRDHVVPLSTQALEIVKRRLAAASGEFMFPVARKPAVRSEGPAERRARRRRGSAPKGTDLPMVWSSRFPRDLRDQAARLLRRDMPAWTIHNLRHTAATHMVEDLGVASDVVSLLLAHRPPGAAVSRIYNRAERLAERRDALTRWAAWVGALT